jgi:signal transduction histidine kinase
MALVAAKHDPRSRRRVLAVYLQHGIAGTILVLLTTWLRRDEPAAVLDALGPSGPLLIVLFFAFASVLSLLKFKLTEQIYVSLSLTAYISMFPLLGMVMSSWIAVAAAVVPRLLGMLQIGPARLDVHERIEWARTLALFATYGVPVIIATWVYESVGGSIPLFDASFASALQMITGALVLILTNNMIVFRVEQAYGYSIATSIKTAAVDSSIYIVTIPYAILTTLAWSGIGWFGLLAAAFTGILANAVGRNLAQVRGEREQIIQRLTSLTNIGKTISLNTSIDDLLMAIYSECRKVIDVSIFNIALYDPASSELAFELNVVEGVVQPKERIAAGEGLNWWVVQHEKSLIIGSSNDERKLGIISYDDGYATQSWLGVPMMSRDNMMGVISVQSFQKNAFTDGDVVLLTAVANQTAVALENVRLYRDLEGLNMALEQRVAERTNELNETNLRLVAADRSKNQFLASMSHELRTPLNAIIGFSTILLDAARTLLPPRLYKFLENIRTAGSHLLELINDILDLAKVESGKLQIIPEKIHVADTVASVERVIKGIAAEHGVTVVSRIDESLTDATLDDNRFKQILLNLLSNAVKFSHRGGFVHLSISALDAANSRFGRETIRIEVADRGIGIPAHELPHIFDEFYQVTEKTHAQKGGTGLGLSLTRNFVELHGGTIDVVSNPGAGTTFTIDLPRHCIPGPPPPRPAIQSEAVS